MDARIQIALDAARALQDARTLTRELVAAGQAAARIQLNPALAAQLGRANNALGGLSGGMVRATQASQQFGQQTQLAFQNATQAINSTGAAATRTVQGQRTVAQAVRQTAASFGIANAAAGGFTATTLAGAGAIRNAFFSLKGALTGLGIMFGVRSMIGSTIAGERSVSSLKAIAEDAQIAGNEFRRLLSESSRLGIGINELGEAYSNLTAATKGTVLQGQETRHIFKAVTEASSTLGLSGERTKLALLAIQQMASKNVVAMQELKLQLGDQIPGALAVSSRAMGMTTQSFIKLVESGQLLAEDFLPKLATELEKTFGFDPSANQLQRAMTGVSNAWKKLMMEIGANSGPVIVHAFNALAEGLEFITKNFYKVIAAVNGLGMFANLAFSHMKEAINGVSVAITASLVGPISNMRYYFEVVIAGIKMAWDSLRYSIVASMSAALSQVAWMFNSMPGRKLANFLGFDVNEVLNIKKALDAGNKRPGTRADYLKGIEAPLKLPENYTANEFGRIHREAEAERADIENYFEGKMAAAYERSMRVGSDKLMPDGEKIPHGEDIDEKLFKRGSSQGQYRNLQFQELVRTQREIEKQMRQLDVADFIDTSKFNDEMALAQAQENFEEAMGNLQDMAGETAEEISRRFADSGESMKDAFTYGAEEALRAFGTLQERMVTFGGEVVNTSVDAITDGLMDIVKGTKGVADAFKAMADAIIYEIMRTAIQKFVVQQLFTSLSFTGAAAHTGGIIGFGSDQPNRFHSGGTPMQGRGGLGPDEVPIVAKRGEVIWTPEQSNALKQMGGKERPIQIVNTFDPRQAAEMIAANPEAILNVLSKNKAKIRSLMH
jgi:tape measure domain-containing protein